MRRSRFLAACLLTVAIAPSCSGTTKSSPDAVGGTGGHDSDAGGTGGTLSPPDAGSDTGVTPSLEGRAFDIQIPFPDSGYPWCQGACTPATALVTRVDDGEMELVWGSTGQAATITLTRSGDVWNFDGSLPLGSYWSWNHAMCPNDSTLGPATFDFADHDDDGRLDLIISGHAVSKICSDDYSSGTEDDVTLLGAPDARAAKVLGPGPGMEPVHGLSIELDKPLEGSATCTLMPTGGGTLVALEPEKVNGYVVGFSTSQVLPLGTTYTTQVSGQDFAGISTPAPIEIAILDDFGVLAQDGFESGSTSGIAGATIVDNWGVLGLNGQRILDVDPGTPALLRLRRAGSEQVLTMTMRKIDECWGMGWDGPFEVSVTVVGADTVEHGTLTMGDNPTTVTSDGGSIAVGELQTITVPLTGTGQDVLVYMLGDFYQGAGCSKFGAIVDDVMLE